MDRVMASLIAAAWLLPARALAQSPPPFTMPGTAPAPGARPQGGAAPTPPPAGTAPVTPGGAAPATPTGQPGYAPAPSYGSYGPGYAPPYGSPAAPRFQYPAPYVPPAGPSSPTGEPRAADHTNGWVTFGLGFTGGGGIAAIDKPDDQALNGQQFTPLYPGFSGVDTAIGPSFELRLLGYFGVEVDVLSVHENGSADITVNNATSGQLTGFNIKMGHGGMHVPLLFKGAIPGRAVTPLVFVGPEFVIPNEDAAFTGAHPDLVISGDNVTGVAHTSYNQKYTMVAFGIGLEINLPVPKVDLRIPVSVRGGYTPSVSNHRGDRMQFEPANSPPFSELAYATVFQWTARAQLGLAAHF